MKKRRVLRPFKTFYIRIVIFEKINHKIFLLTKLKRREQREEASVTSSSMIV